MPLGLNPVKALNVLASMNNHVFEEWPGYHWVTFSYIWLFIIDDLCLTIQILEKWPGCDSVNL